MGFNCPFPGAGWWRIFHFAKNFKEKGHDVHVLSTVSPKAYKQKKIVWNQNIGIYNLLPFISISNPFFFMLNNLLALPTLFMFFLRFRPHAIIISLPPPDQFLSTYLMSKIFKRKLVIDYRDEYEDQLFSSGTQYNFFRVFLKKILTLLYKQVHLITPVTASVAETLKNRALSNVEVIHDGVDTNTFKPQDRYSSRETLGISKDKFVIAYLGNVYEPYRLDVVVDALKILKEKTPSNNGNYMLLIIGGGAVEKILNYSREQKVNELIIHIPPVSDPKKIVNLLNMADIGIIPYDDNPLWKSTLSTKLFEYCACGLPVIATVNVDSLLAKYISTFNLGVIVPPVNSQKLAEFIDKFQKNSETRPKFRSDARQFAECWDKQKLSEKLLFQILSNDRCGNKAVN